MWVNRYYRITTGFTQIQFALLRFASSKKYSSKILAVKNVDLPSQNPQNNHKKNTHTHTRLFFGMSLTSWWFQPNLKNISQIGIISPGIGVKINNLWVATT